MTVAVIGLGASGEAAARLALAKGAEVHVTDANANPAVAARGDVLRRLGADVLLGAHDPERLAAADTVVASPGIPPSAPVLRALRSRGVDWVSEPEFASRFLTSPLIVVTGTNGKTTTASLCAHLLREAGVDAALGGNVGGGLAPPASELAVREPAPERVVLELSSFQLAGVRELSPAVGVMTNLGVDHLDRYGSVAEYHRDKRRLFEAGGEDATWVLNGDDPAVERMAAAFPGARLRFSLEGRPAPGAWVEDGDLMMDVGALTTSPEAPTDGGARRSRGATAEQPGPVRIGRAAALRLPGRHNVANALAAALAAAAAGADPSGFEDALAAFAPLPHRMEPVGTVDGVLWINDSKATNVAACASALRGLAGPLVLLLGGSEKGEEFGALVATMEGKVRGVVAYGDAGPRAAAELRAAVGLQAAAELGAAAELRATVADRGRGADCALPSARASAAVRPAVADRGRGADRAPVVAEVAGGFQDAVARGRSLARPGDALLLSPACPSFDMFRDYRERGRAFRSLAADAGAAPP